LSLVAKLEYYSVVGSLKDRRAYYMTRDAIWCGVVGPSVSDDDPYSESPVPDHEIAPK
jgi:hypothetical protein